MVLLGRGLQQRNENEKPPRFRHYHAYSGIFQYIQTYSCIINYIKELNKHIQNSCVTLVYSEPWHIQYPGHIENPAKDLRRSVLQK